MSKDSLGDRMKRYEDVNRGYLIQNANTIIRIDGRAFHTYTKQFKRPFDAELVKAMDDTAIYLCSRIQGAKFAYVQSDEISIVITDYDSIDSGMWYEGNIQKIVSVSASMAAAKFNQLMTLRLLKIEEKKVDEWNSSDTHYKFSPFGVMDVEIEKMQLAEFDSRVFQLPSQTEVNNYFLWRQQDCTRNSISSVAQSMYSHKDLHGVNTDQMQELIFKKGTNWNDFDPKLKRGRFIAKKTYVWHADMKPKNMLDEWPEGIDLETIPMREIMLTDKVRTMWKSIECPIFSQDTRFTINRLPSSIL